MKHILKEFIDAGVLDFQALVLKYYHKLDLNDREAVALMKLHALLQENEQIIKPKQFSKWLAASPNETEALLNSLMSKGYLTILLTEDEDGKEFETFNVDFFLTKVVEYLKEKLSGQKEETLQDIVSYLEDMLKKPLNQMDLELVKQWVYDEHYPFELIKDATHQALERKYPSVKHIDHILLNDLGEKSEKKPTKNKEALKEFHKLWDE